MQGSRIRVFIRIPGSRRDQRRQGCWNRATRAVSELWENGNYV